MTLSKKTSRFVLPLIVGVSLLSVPYAAVADPTGPPPGREYADPDDVEDGEETFNSRAGEMVNEEITAQQKTVDELFHEAEVITEEYNALNEELEQLERDLLILKEDQVTEQIILDEAQSAAESTIVLGLQTQSMMDTTNRMILSGSITGFVEHLTVQRMADDVLYENILTYEKFLKRVEERQLLIDNKRSKVFDLHTEAAAKKELIETLHAEAVEKLETLQEEELLRQEEEALRLALEENSDLVGPDGEPLIEKGSKEHTIIAFAKAQLGDRYVWGGNGPHVWDCSGLTKGAYAQAGTSTPRTAKTQFAAGKRIELADLMPGDMVFYYEGITHVGIYVGDGKIIHAANPRKGVIYSGLFSMPYKGAVRF